MWPFISVSVVASACQNNSFHARVEALAASNADIADWSQYRCDGFHSNLYQSIMSYISYF